jgi:hypothetical protein
VPCDQANVRLPYSDVCQGVSLGCASSNGSVQRILTINPPPLALASFTRIHVLISLARLTNANNIELEATLQELLLDLGGDAVETDVALGKDTLGSLRLRRADVGHVGGIGGCGVVFNGVSGVSAQRLRSGRRR